MNPDKWTVLKTTANGVAIRNAEGYVIMTCWGGSESPDPLALAADICDMHNAQLDAAPKRDERLDAPSPYPTADEKAEARRKEKRRHDDALEIAKAEIMHSGWYDSEAAFMATAVAYADALQAALAKGGAK